MDYLTIDYSLILVANIMKGSQSKLLFVLWIYTLSKTLPAADLT